VNHTPDTPPADQQGFWTPEWRCGEAQADAQIAAGGLPVYDDMAALFAAIAAEPDTDTDTQGRETPVPEATIAALHTARAEMDARFARRAAGEPDPDRDPALPLIVVIDETQELLRRPVGAEARELAAHILADLSLDAFAEQVATERHRQLNKWGDQRRADDTGGALLRRQADAARSMCQASERHTPGGAGWRLVLGEEVAEAFAEADPARLRAELIQVAAVAAAWIYDIDRREPDPGQAPA
jgi:hypothetical protein